MDLKEIEIIAGLHKKIFDKQCCEADIYSFLILLRTYTKEKTPTREFGDFIAHREKDRGFINEYLIRNKEILDNLGKVNSRLVISEVFSFEEIKSSFNETLNKVHLQEFTDENIRIIIVMIISLLQEVSIVDRSKNSIGKLQFAISRDQIVLLGRVWIQNKVFAVFPVLSVENWIEKDISSSIPLTLNKIIKVIIENGTVKLETTSIEIK
jgi:hypothetical protein